MFASRAPGSRRGSLLSSNTGTTARGWQEMARLCLHALNLSKLVPHICGVEHTEPSGDGEACSQPKLAAR